MRRRSKQAEVTLAVRDEGLVVTGEPGAVQRQVDRLRDAVESNRNRWAGAAELLTHLGSVSDALKQRLDADRPQLIELSPESMRLLREHGAIPGDDGFFKALVHDGRHIAGNVEWRPVEGATLADLATLQNAAMALALRASVKQITDAVARIESKVDTLVDKLESQEIGTVVTHHRRLGLLRNALDEGRPLSTTDWESVQSLGTETSESIDRIRTFLNRRLDTIGDRSWTARGRASQVRSFLDDDLPALLALLAVCEHNFSAWQELRLERVRATEPDVFDHTVELVDAELASHREADRALVERLTAFVEMAIEATGYEGFEVLARLRLQRDATAVSAATQRFADQRALPVSAPDVELPGLRDSLREALGDGRSVATRYGSLVAKGAWHGVSSAGRSASAVGRSVPRTVRRRARPDDAGDTSTTRRPE